MKNVCLCLLALLFVCCRSDNAVPATGIVGVWQLTDYCKPMRVSACQSTTIPADKGVYISFTNDGKFNETYENTKPVEYGFLGCGSGIYSMEGNKVRIRAVCMSSLDGQLYDIVSITANQLVLNAFGTGEYVFVKR